MRRLLLLLCLYLPSWSLAAAEPLSLFVSIPPQAWLLDQLGGDHLKVQTMLGVGSNPHSYDPAARQLVALGDARAYFTIGIPFEAMWQERLAAINEHLIFFHCGAATGEHADHDHSSSVHSDPHIWTSPLEASAIAECMHAALVQLDSANREIYDANLAKLQQQLFLLDQQIMNLLAKSTRQTMLVQHPAWSHFAERYGLKQLAIEDHGHEPNARHLVDVIERGRKLGLDRIIIQRQYSPAAARLVARAIGARLIEAEPMAYDYPASLLRLAHALVAKE